MKIGFTQNRVWDGRSNAYKTCGSWPEFIGEIDGPHIIEQYIQEKFKDSRIPGTEFFEYDEEVEDIFKTGVYYRGKLYKPVIENYKEVHKQTSTFDLLENIDFGNITKSAVTDLTKIEDLCKCRNSEYRSFDGTWINEFPNNFNPGYVYFDIENNKIIYFRAPATKKTAIYGFKDENLNPDILGNEVLYWSDMSLNGFLSFSKIEEVKDILLDLKNKRYEYRVNPLYSIWCKNKKEGD